jgi:DNA-binding NarL/FixJ family response regulator
MQQIRLMLINSPALKPIFATCDIFKIIMAIEAKDLHQAREEARRLQPDAIIYKAGDKENIPLELLSKIKEVCPLSLMIIFASSEAPEEVAAALKAGADSYLLDGNMLPAEIVEAVELICQAKVCFFPASARELFEGI